MNRFEIESIRKARDYNVIKSNDLVLKSRYHFSLIAQKSIAYICSMIRPSQNDRSGFVLEYEFDILEYASICGISNSGTLYHDVKSALKNLRDSSMWLTLPNGSETLVGWLDRVTIDEGCGKVKVKIDDRLVPYLFDLQNRYLCYGLKNILCMRSKFSIRLYEMFRAYYGFESAVHDNRPRIARLQEPVPYEWKIDIDELKRKLMVDTIKSYSDNGLFKAKVLEPACREINRYSDIYFEYEMIKTGKKVTDVRFTINFKNMLERTYTEAKAEQTLETSERK